MSIENVSYLKSFYDEWSIKIVCSSDDLKENLILQCIQEAYKQKFAEDVIREILEKICRTADVPLAAALEKIKEHVSDNKINPFDGKNNREGDEPIDWIMVGHAFLIFLKDFYGYKKFIFWEGDYYYWKDGQYFKTSSNEIKSLIVTFVQSKMTKLRFKKLSLVQEELMRAVNSISFLSKELDLPFLITGKSYEKLKAGQRKTNWISLKNGTINIDEVLRTGEVKLHPHNENYFSLTQLQYGYDDQAICQRWERVLLEIFEDKDKINFLQEWFGYNLISHCHYQKFLVLFGPGGAGKSVILKVLSLMLGDGNYCSVGLENFDAKRSFGLAGLNGMMANIIFDLNEVDKSNEGILKQFVAGEPITVERKHKDPFTMKSTAKLTIAANNELRFSDKTDGIWRRLVYLVLKKQILDESKQDTRLVSDDWWLKSSELPGVFNWALEGLIRLEKRGHFKVPDSMNKDLTNYRVRNNAAAIFIETHLIKDEKGEVPSHWLYRDYKSFCISNGYSPQNSQNFAKDLRRSFPELEISDDTSYAEDPKKIEKIVVKTRMWKGICDSHFLGSGHVEELNT